MNRRTLAAVAACVLAAVGAVLLIGYVRGADSRAQAAEEQVQVLVVDSEILEGTSAERLRDQVSLTDVPARLVSPGALTDLADVAGRVTTAVLLPGEQLRSARFVVPSSLLPAGTVPKPDGMEEISLTLEPQRAVNGALRAGDRVSIFSTVSIAGGGSQTALVHGNVLVSRVSATSPGGTDSSGAIDTAAVGTDPVTVTIALPVGDISAVVAGMEAETVWLSLVTSLTIGDAQ